jgi:hypothetical protein
MGDRCFLQVTVRRDQAEQLKGILGDPDEETMHNDWSMSLEYHQANYGLSYPLMEASSKGLVFYGFHGNGTEYGSREFFSDPSGVAETMGIPMGPDGCGYVIHGDTPELRLAALQRLEEVILMQNDVRQRVDNALYALVTEGGRQWLKIPS